MVRSQLLSLVFLVATVDGGSTHHLVDDNPEMLQNLKSSVEEHGSGAYMFHDVCEMFNIDAKDMENRGIVFFDKSYKHAKRCVPCNNPVMSFKWDEAHTADLPGKVIPGLVLEE
jgi:hypothetical protein